MVELILAIIVGIGFVGMLVAAIAEFHLDRKNKKEDVFYLYSNLNKESEDIIMRHSDNCGMWRDKPRSDYLTVLYRLKERMYKARKVGDNINDMSTTAWLFNNELRNLEIEFLAPRLPVSGFNVCDYLNSETQTPADVSPKTFHTNPSYTDKVKSLLESMGRMDLYQL